MTGSAVFTPLDGTFEALGISAKLQQDFALHHTVFIPLPSLGMEKYR